MKFYTYGSDLSTLDFYTLSAERTANIDAYDARKEVVLAEVSALIENNIPGYKVAELGNSVLYLTAKDAKRRLDIDISFGENLFKSDALEFRINPSSIGSFNIDIDSDERNYFIAIGTLLSNSEFHTVLRGTLLNWYFESKQFVESWRVLGNEITRREQANKKEAEREEMIDHFNENIRPHFNQDLTDMWVLVEKKPAEHMVNATYRKTPIRILSAPGDMYKISGIKNSYDRMQAINFAVIPAAKVKLID